MKNVLIFPCGSEIGLELYKSLRFSTHFNLVGGSSSGDHGMYVYENYISDLPYVGDEDFIEKINNVISDNHIDFIFPAHDSVVLKLAEEAAAGNLGCEVVTSSAETCAVSRSKAQTYKSLKGVVPTPKVFGSIDELEVDAFPVFLKPDVGQGSKGTFIAKSREDVAFYTAKDPSLLLLEYLPGIEYTIDCFTDRNGELLFSEGRVRNRISNGISVNSSAVEDERFTELALSINKALKFRGAWFFQVKQNQAGELVLMEIAPRIAGTMGLARCRGVNLVLLSLFDRIGYDISIIENNYSMTIDRALQNSYKHNIAYKHVYLDFDDLVILDGKVNPAIMAFVYQCINKKIQVHLLTKHKDDLDESLKKYHLSGVFDEVIWIRDDSEKPGHITERDAIFIDDSFAERKIVQQTCNLPVFDSHMVEALMEKF
jgi:predicted ATP-grasp superfamily ATP-dependent carboligase